MLFVMCVKGSIDVPIPVKVLDNDDPNRLRSPETFLSVPGIQAEAMINPVDNSVETNVTATEMEQGTIVSEKKPEENNEDKQALSEDSEEDSDDDIVVAAGNFTLSSMENNMASLSQQNSNANSSSAGINLKRNNLLTLTNVPGMSTGSKVSKTNLMLLSKTVYTCINIYYILASREV